MINTDDKLLCIQGNDFYLEDEIYTVGRIVNNKPNYKSSRLHD